MGLKKRGSCETYVTEISAYRRFRVMDHIILGWHSHKLDPSLPEYIELGGATVAGLGCGISHQSLGSVYAVPIDI